MRSGGYSGKVWREGRRGRCSLSSWFGVQSMGLWMMCVVRVCDMRHDGACPDIVIEEGGGLLKATHSPRYLAGKCEKSTKEKGE